MDISIRDFSCRAGHFDPTLASGATRGGWTYTTRSYHFILLERTTRVTIGDETLSLPMDTLLCVRPGETYTVQLPCSAYYILVGTEDESHKTYLDSWPRTMVLCDAERCAALMRDIAMAEQEENVKKVISAVMILSDILEQERRVQQDASRVPTEKTRETVRRGIEYMDAHFREKCTLEEVASYVGRSAIYFHDTFEEVAGESPYEYITRLRLNEAKRLLAFTSEPPADIAVRCGYGSQSYFNYVFKKAMGITPLTYRRENNKCLCKE
ncbi:MAG: helix-turn-helix transcriptional regulator [Clostridia bacterium]|nr:helix-turn-helix transcriptional regulator [Clostridia bacterium]